MPAEGHGGRADRRHLSSAKGVCVFLRNAKTLSVFFMQFRMQNRSALLLELLYTGRHCGTGTVCTIGPGTLMPSLATTWPFSIIAGGVWIGSR